VNYSFPYQLDLELQFAQKSEQTVRDVIIQIFDNDTTLGF